ncbi:MAG: rhodanese-like domain-containing protein [Planctomycetes bacterium]|nr:rhodanese-like domain-containing protein [Planctomycetota bacterium]MCP4365314.1 rhodanese-like domain-containing protein [Planctomycetota bacterium]
MEEIVSGLLAAEAYPDSQNYYWTKRVNISAEQAKNLIDSKPSTVVVDVREEDEYCSGYIPEALMSPWTSGVFQTEYNTILPSSGGVLLACRSGNRSVEASDFLGSSSGGNYTKNNKNSVVVYNMLGGMNDWSYSTSTCNQADYNISDPADGSTLSSSSVTFSWDSGAEQYHLWIGTSPGSNDIYNGDQGTNTSAVISGLPSDSETLYARLWSKVSGTWYYDTDRTYTACNIKTEIQSPTPGSTLSSTSQIFTWNSIDASQYWLWVGTSKGGNDVYNKDQETNTSATVSGLPQNGETLYVRVWFKLNGAWSYSADSTYTACDYTSAAAWIQSPTPGSTLSSATGTFTWNNSGASQYWLWIGTSAGSNDIYNGGQGTNTSAVISGLPGNGETLYVRLLSKTPSGWSYNTDSIYTACSKNPDIAVIQTPAPGSTMGSTTATFTWNNSGAEEYWLWIGTSAGGNDVLNAGYGTDTSAVISGLPSSGESLYVRLWSKKNGAWLFDTDNAYTAVGP